MSKQGSLPKISLIVQKMKIGQNSIYALFAWSPSNAMVNDSRNVTDNSKDGIHNYLFQVTLAKNLLRQYPASKVLFSGPWQVSDQDLSLSLSRNGSNDHSKLTSTSQIFWKISLVLLLPIVSWQTFKVFTSFERLRKSLPLTGKMLVWLSGKVSNLLFSTKPLQSLVQYKPFQNSSRSPR